MPPLIGKRGAKPSSIEGAVVPDGLQTERRTARQIRGAGAEQAALDHLLKHGLKLVARNVRYRAGELDLVMRDGAVLVFIEVRARAAAGWGGAAASVDGGKQRKLIRAAQLYLQIGYGNCPPACRFDIMVFDGHRIDWLRDAFSA